VPQPPRYVLRDASQGLERAIPVRSGPSLRALARLGRVVADEDLRRTVVTDERDGSVAWDSALWTEEPSSRGGGARADADAAVPHAHPHVELSPGTRAIARVSGRDVEVEVVYARSVSRRGRVVGRRVVVRRLDTGAVLPRPRRESELRVRHQARQATAGQAGPRG